MRISLLVILCALCIAPPIAQADISPWLGSATAGNTVFLASASDAHIDRYDMSQQTWLAPIALAAVPTSFIVSGNSLIVSDANTTTRYSLDGSNPQALPGALPNAISLGVANGILYETPPGQVQSYDLQNLRQIDQKNDISYQDPYGFVIDLAHGRLTGNQLGVGPPSMVYWSIHADGTFGASATSSDFDYPIDVRNFMSVDGLSIVNSGGVVWSSATLLHTGGIGGPFDALVQVGSDSILVRRGTLYRVSATYHELGRFKLDAPAQELATDGTRVFAFHQTAGNAQAEIVPLAAIVPPVLPAPPDASHIDYVADQIEVGPTGIVYLLDIAQAAIFRFDLTSWSYLPAVPLAEAPLRMTVDPANSDAYVAYDYPSFEIGVIRAGSGNIVPFVYTLTQPFGVSVAGASVFVVDGGGGLTHRLVDKQYGRETASRDDGGFSKQYVWCAAHSRLYLYDDDAEPDNLQYETVTSTTAISFPTYDRDQWGWTIPTYPIRVDPTCTYVVNGAGQIFNASTLAITTTLSEQPTDIAWLGSTMFDIVPGAAGTSLIHKFNSTYSIVGKGTVIGTPQRLVTYAGNLYAITNENGATLFTKVVPALTGNDLSVLSEAATPAPAAGALAGVEFYFANQGPAGPASAAISITPPLQLTSIDWECQADGATEYTCGTGGALNANATLAAGQGFTAIGYFTTPATSEGQLIFNAQITAQSGVDAVPQNNAATVTLALDHLFADGFE